MNIKIVHTKNLRWIDIINPEEPEYKYLRENFNFHPLDFQDLASESQHTKIEIRDDYMFMVLLFPVFNRATREIVPAEIDFFISKNYLITIHDGSMYTMLNMIKDVSSQDASRNMYMGKNAGYLLYHILEGLFKRSFPILDHISKDMVEIEARVFKDLDLRMLKKIALMKRNIIDTRRIMKTHHLIIKKLMNRKENYMAFPNSQEYYELLLEHAENIWDILAIQKETIEALQDANQSMATNQLNELNRAAAIVSTIFFPATLVLFAFQLDFKSTPFKDNPFAFWIILLIAGTASALMYTYFKNKKWL